MRVDFEVGTSEEYFQMVEKDIDWNEIDWDDSMVSIKQANEIAKILSTEASIFLLRNASNVCGSLVDSMVEIRRELINKYEVDYEPYIEYNDFY